MRTVIAIEFVTLDGVVQGPGGPDEDPSGGFEHGGWIRPYADAAQVAWLKQEPGPDLHVYGSAKLLQTLLEHDLVDALWLRIHPITLGEGKRLFDGGAIPAAFRVVESEVTSS